MLVVDLFNFLSVYFFIICIASLLPAVLSPKKCCSTNWNDMLTEPIFHALSNEYNLNSQKWNPINFDLNTLFLSRNLNFIRKRSKLKKYVVINQSTLIGLWIFLFLHDPVIVLDKSIVIYTHWNFYWKMYV